MSILLQNSLDAKRSYGTLVSVKMEQYGELRGVFTTYSADRYKEVIMETYKKAGIDPATVAYIEADGCAIKVRSTVCKKLIIIIYKKKKSNLLNRLYNHWRIAAYHIIIFCLWLEFVCFF